MSVLEMEFLDEYKSVDKICKDMYSSKNGVTAYIECMESTNYMIQSKIPLWNQDYRSLKRMRRIRNQIAHESNSECTENDLLWLSDFHSRLINCQDPLVYARQIKKDNEHKSVAQKPIAKIEKLPVKGTKNSNETNRILMTMVIAALVVAVVLAAIFMLSLINQYNTALV